MANDDKAKSDRVFDVSKPGKTAPDSSSRPVIVGNRTILKDPMVAGAPEVDEESTEDNKIRVKTNSSEATPSSDGEKVIQPPEDKTEKETKKKPEIAPEEVETKKPEDEKVETATVESKEEAPEEKKEPETEKSEDDDGDGEPTASQQAQTQKETDKVAKEELAKKEAAEKLVADKTYFVPIGEVKRKRSKRRNLVWVFVILLLGIVLADVLIDSGVINTSIEAPVHIFKITN